MKTLTFIFDGEQCNGRPGDTIAAALQAAGHLRLGWRRDGRPRGVYCGMGVCQDCVVTVNGVGSVRACMTELQDGMTIGAQDDRRRHAQGDRERISDNADAPEPDGLTTDLFIVGAGPAGLEAAIAAAHAGLSVVVADERSAPGGQYFKPLSEAANTAKRDSQHRAGDRLRDRFAASGATLVAGAIVWYARRDKDGFAFRFLSGGRECAIKAPTVILATGAYERPAVVPGWTEPGVMTIGAAQTFARRYGVAPGQRLLIAGQGPLGLQLAVEVLNLGAQVVGVAERSRMVAGGLLRASIADPALGARGAAYLARLAAARVPVWRDTEIGAITAAGQANIRDVELKRVVGAGKRNVAADTICMGDGFLPQFELARLLGWAPVRDESGYFGLARDEIGATEVPGLWIAGDGGGLGGAQVALAQGRLSGLAAARHLGHETSADQGAVARLRRARRFQAALWTAFQAPPRAMPGGETIVCRCESVSATAIDHAIADGATDIGTVKRATRCAMGRCQGRFCLPTLVGLLEQRGVATRAEDLMAPQLPARPVRAGALAREKPEWGGHRPALTIARPGRAAREKLPVEAIDVLVIGAGITGLCAALYAARNGASVLCIDRGRAGAEASGGNAGSLHLQLLSWDFGAKAFADGSAALRTLPAQAESIALWSALENELSTDFQIKMTGGLMLAENPDQIAFLEAKTAAEAKVGVEAHVIGQSEIATIAPALSDRFAAAAWCAKEGKINPLSANAAILSEVRRIGAIVAERCPATAIVSDGAGYRVATPRGSVHARRVIIAAGGWSAQIGALMGFDLPIRGAPLQMIVTEPAPPLVNCLVAHADRHLTLKQAAAGSLLIGGAWPAAVNDAGQPEILPESLEGNLWVAARTLPAIAGLSVIRSWAAMNIDIDGAPLLSHLPGHPNVVVAATANGYTLGPLMGREAAAGVLDGAIRADLAEFGLCRFHSSTGKDHS